MRLPRISLAAKYRLLFGLAVLLIIGAALYVPGYRMERLVEAQAFREAQRVADNHFRLIMPEPDAAPPGNIHGEEFSLLPQSFEQRVRYLPLRLPDADAALQSQKDPFVGEAMRRFILHPNYNVWHVITSAPAGRRFQYAHAVRVSKRCLSCHDEDKTATPFRENQLAGIITVDLPADVSTLGLNWNRAVIIAAGLLAGVLAIVVFYVITHKFILAPIEELRAVALRVTAGDLDVRSNVHTGDEFEQLSDNLNAMLERLRASQEELKTANRSLDQKLGEIAETNVALFEANRVKSEFIANVSHELRTPLTSIIGFAELLRESAGDESSKQARYAENILISGRILLEIINDLLDLAKIEAGKVEMKIEPLAPVDVCTPLIDFMRPIADKRRIHLHLEVEPEIPAMLSDRGKLRQVLFNLLSNAIKFSPEGGVVSLNLRRDGDARVRFEVVDAGPGIAPEHHALIFEKFRQIDQSHTREQGGTGLGLAIAKELTYLLGGEIGVQSELGKGATFWLALPTHAPAPRDRPLVSLL